MTLNIIHLPSRIDRLKTLQNELSEQNISDYKIWKGAIDSSIIARGISQSHKQIVRYAKEVKLSSVLICEDDLKFTAPLAFQFYLNNIPNDYDIYLGSIYHGLLKEDNTVNNFSGLTLYIVNERFYDKFLSMPEQNHLDRSLRNSGKFIVCNPFIAIQYNGYSDNKKKYCNYDIYLKDRKLYGL